MRFLNLSSNDYANASHDNARALRSIGVDCHDFTLNDHNFEYASCSKTITRKQMQDLIPRYDIIQIFHSCEQILSMVKRYPRKDYVVYHTGSRYRNNPIFYNNLFRGAKAQLTDQCEFMKLGNMSYIAPWVKPMHIDKPRRNKLVLGHYPSNPVVKGTAKIREMVEPFAAAFDIRINEKPMSHAANMQRIADCDIYIELFQPYLRGKEYGCFGVTAFEAAAAGCLVITQNLNSHVYQEAYGNHPFLICNDEKTFEHTLKFLAYDMDKTTKDNAILEMNTYLRRHSIEPTGERILKLTT